MQFIDQSAAYRSKAISLQQAISSGRAQYRADTDAEGFGKCFRPDLEKATGFDKDIDGQVKFNGLTTPEKLDLMIEKLLPLFFVPGNLGASGRDSWDVHFLIDGASTRRLRFDDDGVRAVEDSNEPAAVALETDMATLMALLRWVIAQYHHKRIELGRKTGGD